MDTISIGQRLKSYREAVGLRQGQIAAYLNIDQSMVSKIEADERAITSEQLHALSELYGCAEEELLNGDAVIRPLKFALRAKEISDEDLRIVAVINRIAANSSEMAKLLEVIS